MCNVIYEYGVDASLEGVSLFETEKKRFATDKPTHFNRQNNTNERKLVDPEPENKRNEEEVLSGTGQKKKKEISSLETQNWEHRTRNYQWCEG